MKGTFYAVGVGPGDPELLTLKALRVLERCPVIAAPRAREGESLALAIAGQAVDLSGKEILPLSFLMTRDEAAAAARHREIAAEIAARLEEGRDVAMPSLGDASLYATAAYIRRLIAEAGYSAEVVPGVPSFCACAARLGVSLTTPRLPLRILPGDYPELAAELAAPGTKVVMKQGKHLDTVLEALKQAGLWERAMLACDCGLPGERLLRRLDGPDGENGAEEGEFGYFTTIIVGE